MDEDDYSPRYQSKGKRPKCVRSAVVWLLVLLIMLVTASGAAAYWWCDSRADEDVGRLEKRITELEAELAVLSDDEQEETEPADPSAATRENIEAAVESGNYAALESVMSETVTVILAASEAYGPQTPTEAVVSMEYLDNATPPWDFNLPASTLSTYASGDYSGYFPSDALVGKSTDNYVVSFTFDATGNIDGIFISPDEDLL